MDISSKILIAFTIMAPVILLGSIGMLGVGVSIEQENTLNPTSSIGTNAGGIKGDCGNPNVSQYAEFINAAALRFNVPAPVIAGVIEQESGGNREAKSEVGAQGLMQVMPETWQEIRSGSVAPNPKEPTIQVTATKNQAGEKLPDNPFDPQANIYAGSFYLRQRLTEFDGNLLYAVASYNAGAGNVHKYHGVPPFSQTQNYVHMIVGTAQKVGYISKYVDCLGKESTSSSTVPTNNAEARQAVLTAARAAEGTFPACSGQYCGLQAMAVYDKAGVKKASYNDTSNQIPNATAADLGPGDMVRISVPNGTTNNDHMIILDSPVQTPYGDKTVTVWSFWSGDASNKWRHTGTDPSKWHWPSSSAVIPYNPAAGANGPPLQVWTPQPRQAK